MRMRLYHFTAAHIAYVPPILVNGIERTESNISRSRRHAGPPVVWLTDEPDPNDITWPAIGKKSARFTIDAEAEPWLAWAEARGGEIDWLTDVAGGREAAAHWFTSERAIHRTAIVELRLYPRDDLAVEQAYAGGDLRRLLWSAAARRTLPLLATGRRVAAR